MQILTIHVLHLPAPDHVPDVKRVFVVGCWGVLCARVCFCAVGVVVVVVAAAAAVVCCCCCAVVVGGGGDGGAQAVAL